MSETSEKFLGVGGWLYFYKKLRGMLQHIHMAYKTLWRIDMSDLKSRLKGLFKPASEENRKSQTDSDESEIDIDEIDMPDGTKFKIPEMPPSRPHWG